MLGLQLVVSVTQVSSKRPIEEYSFRVHGYKGVDFVSRFNCDARH